MFPFTTTNRGTTVFIDGKPRQFDASHASYSSIVEALESGDESAVRNLVDVKQQVAEISLGRVRILDNCVMVAGKRVSGKLVDRILEMVSRGSKAVDGYIRFLDNLMLNPSKTAKDEVYLFVEACDLPITPEGNFLAYKRVGNDGFDLYSHSIDNSVGESPTMDRNDVDDKRENTCSQGLHFCSYNYLPAYGVGGGNRVMVVSVNPANVVSIPNDYQNAKGRTWTYDVVGEIMDWEGERITPWYTDEYSDPDVDLDDLDDMFDDDLEGNLEGNLDYDYHYFLDDDDDVEDILDQLATPSPIDTSGGTAVESQGTKLSASDVRAMRVLLASEEYTLKEIGDKFGVCRRTVGRIRDRESWPDLE